MGKKKPSDDIATVFGYEVVCTNRAALILCLFLAGSDSVCVYSSRLRGVKTYSLDEAAIVLGNEVGFIY